MIKNYCDRCKKEIRKGIIPRFVLKVYKLYSWDGFGSQIDLCPECTKSLSEWFDNPENDNK